MGEILSIIRPTLNSIYKALVAQDTTSMKWTITSFADNTTQALKQQLISDIDMQILWTLEC